MLVRQTLRTLPRSILPKQTFNPLFLRTFSQSTMVSTQNLTVREPSVALDIPKMYQSDPPPHHPSANADKCFHSPWPSAGPGAVSPREFLRYRLFEWEKPKPEYQKIPKMQNCKWVEDDAKDTSSLEGKIAFTWIGHAGCHFRIPVPGSDQYVTVLTDPVLSQRCSPVQWMGPARFQAPPTSVSQMSSDHNTIPNIWPDIVALSHNHYDHLDLNTIKAFLSPPDDRTIPHFVCTLGVKDFFLSLGVKEEGITEMDWWQQREFGWNSGSGSEKSLKLTCVPAQHFSGRTLWDRAKSLWAGFVFETVTTSSTTQGLQGKKVYFAGDSGFRYVSREHVKSGKSDDELPYCPAFEEIGQLLGPIDVSAIPIGAYKPKPALSMVHMDPKEAIEVHKHVRSKNSIAIHWGSFDLSAEGYTEPPAILKEEMAKSGLPIDQFTSMQIGQTRYF